MRCLLPQGDPGIYRVQRHQQKDRHAAVDVGPVIQPRLHGHVHAVPCDHVEEGKIEGQGIRKIELAEVGQVQGRIFRNEEHGRHSPREQGKEGETKSCAHHLPQGQTGADEPEQEKQDQKNADHDGNIIIGQDAQSQTDAVKLIFPLFYQSLQPQSDQREEENAVQPHHVPVIGCKIAGKGIENREGHQKEALRAKMPGQIKTEGKAAQTDFQGDQPGHEFDQISVRDQNDQPVEGACHIVAVQREKIGTDPHIPGIEKTFPIFQPVLHFRKEGNVLMIHVGVHEAFVSEGINPVDDENAAHDGEGNEKGEQAGHIPPGGCGQLPEGKTLRECCVHG